MPPLRPVVTGNEMIMPTECVRNIGVMFDHNLTMDQQITSVCKSAFFHISKLGKSGNRSASPEYSVSRAKIPLN